MNIENAPSGHAGGAIFVFVHVANMLGPTLFEQIFVGHIQDLFDTL